MPPSRRKAVKTLQEFDPAEDSVLPSEPAAEREKTRRMAPAQRHAMLLERATVFFAENGMSSRTRALADACGVAQRLLYRYFPSKAALMRDVYQQAILAPFQPVWLTRLADRTVPIELRLCRFYEEYYETVLSRRWIRLFLFGGLEGADMASDYIGTIIVQLLTVLVNEAAHAKQVVLPQTPALVHELGWVLHGAVSHLAIRQHVYGASQSTPPTHILGIHVAAFLEGLPAAASRARQAELDLREIPQGKTKSSVYD